MSLTDRCIRGSQFIGFYERARYANLDRVVTKKFPSKWNNFTTGNSQLGEEGVCVCARLCVCVCVWFFSYLLTRPEWQTHRTVRGLTETAAFDASQGIHEINNRQRKQGNWITTGWVCVFQSRECREEVRRRQQCGIAGRNQCIIKYTGVGSWGNALLPLRLSCLFVSPSSLSFPFFFFTFSLSPTPLVNIMRSFFIVHSGYF